MGDSVEDAVRGPAGFDQQRLNLVAYGEDRMQVFDNLTVTAGGRFERYGPYPMAVMPRGSARYDLRPGVFVHGSAGTTAARRRRWRSGSGTPCGSAATPTCRSRAAGRSTAD